MAKRAVAAPAAEPAAANGLHPDSPFPDPNRPEPAPREPRIEDWVALDAPYSGFRALVWVNFPGRLWGEIFSGDGARSVAALRRVVLRHNGWLDSEGEPLPAADADSFYGEISTQLALSLMRAVETRARALPNSPTRPGGR